MSHIFDVAVSLEVAFIVQPPAEKGIFCVQRSSVAIARPQGALSVFSYAGRKHSKRSHCHESIHHRVVGPESEHSFPPHCQCLDVLVFNKSPDREVEASLG